MIISIGYAACHWCHVMERECFEDEEIARAMNENYLSRSKLTGKNAPMLTRFICLYLM